VRGSLVGARPVYAQQVATLVLEATVMIAIILGLFRARTVFGLTPLYIVLGGFQYLEAVLGYSVYISPNIVIRPASAVLFVTSLVAVLLVYLKEDAIEARKLVYGLVLANAAVSAMSLIIGWHIDMPNLERDLGFNGETLRDSSWISLVGTSLLFLDVLGIILVYEFVSNLVRSLFLRFYLSLLVILAFDNVVFLLITQGQNERLGRIIVMGFAGKAFFGLFYAVFCWAYLRYVEPRISTVGTGDVADVFQALTYRQKYEAARQRMVRDGLTGLYNRAYFDEALPAAMSHAERYHEPLSLVMIDTDHFKRINDELSHLEGDNVLRTIADTLRAESRASDVPCRYGGDEFVVLLGASDAEVARGFAERFRAALTARCQTADPPPPWGLVTTTIGIASYPADGDVVVPADLIRVADARLYTGKHAGRDRVVVTA
jgi:diguanylate cyclase (GGDEF)-like protein